MEYTEERHAKNLLRILGDKSPCELCPVMSDLKYYASIPRGGFDDKSHCDVCQAFICTTGEFPRCPCWQLGGSEAIKRTWLALEEKGYI